MRQALLAACALAAGMLASRADAPKVPVLSHPEAVKDAFADASKWLVAGRPGAGEKPEVVGAFVICDPSTGATFYFRPEVAWAPFGPCSTFKIWNSLIGLEEKLIEGPDKPFWKWDGETRDFPGWNRDQTWREAFAVSCVPAFQDLARKIGPERMQAWLDKLGYGNRDMAGRPDAFWLPRSGEKTVMISPVEQAAMIRKLLQGQLPVSASSVALLREVMKAKQTAKGTLYGKTGSGSRSGEAGFDMGWYVGFVESGGHAYPFACLVLGSGLSGKNARDVVEKSLEANGLL